MDSAEQAQNPSLLLIDCLNIVRRCYEANPAPDSAEKATAACNSALASFRRALNQCPTTHVLVAMDHGGPTWRHELYPAYKAARKPMPQELRDALPAFLAQLQKELNLVVVSIPGVEADDVIATVCNRWLTCKGGKVIIISTDKDLCTLVSDRVIVRDHFKPEWRDESWVLAKFGVYPVQLGDYLALTGDATDGIPGVESIGPKTAAKLLIENLSLTQVLEAADTLKGKVGENLRAGASMAQLSRQLVAFKLDVQVGVTWNQLLLPR